MIRKFNISFFLLTFLFIISSLHSIDKSRRNVSFARRLNSALKLADNEEYQKALDIFYKSYLNEKDENRKYISLYLTCAVLKEMGQFALAEKLILKNESHFSKAKYPSLHRLKSKIQYAIKNSNSSVVTGIH